MTAPVEPRCERTDLLVRDCAHCRGDELPGSRDTLPPPEWWTVALRDGGCPACHHRIRVGDRIALCDGEWVCEGCGTEAGT